MLELYDRKFILTTEDGKLVSTYHDYYDAQIDAKHLTEVHKDEKFIVWSTDEDAKIDGECLSRTWELKESFQFEKTEKASEIEEEKPEDSEEEKSEE